MIETLVPIVLVGVLVWVIWRHLTKPGEPLDPPIVIVTPEVPKAPQVPMVHPNPCVNIPVSPRPVVPRYYPSSPAKRVDTPTRQENNTPTPRSDDTWVSSPPVLSAVLMASSWDHTSSSSSSSSSSSDNNSSSSYSGDGGSSGGGGSSGDY